MNPEDLFELTGAFESFVPPSFFQVLHLARVLFSWGKVLDPVALGKLRAAVGSDDRQREQAPRSVAEGVPVLGGYQVHPVFRRVRSFEEIGLVDPAELALKELPELVREAEERELTVRVPTRDGAEGTTDKVVRLEEGGAQGALDDAEQKLYLLLDKSFSMRNDFRLLYAKALLLWFLREKYAHGRNPMLFYRGFAVRVTPLARARSRAEIPAVVREILLAEPDEKGTNINLALFTAIDDIKASSLLHDAQILLVSDGLDILDLERLKEARGEAIRIHLVKIGGDRIDPTDAEMKDLGERFGIPLENKDQIRDLYVDTITRQFQEITDTILEVPDVRPGDLDVPADEVQPLVDFAEARVLAVPVDDPDAAEAHRAAVFLSHSLDFLVAHARGDVRGALEDVQRRVNEWLARRVRNDAAVRDALAKKNLNLVLERNMLDRLKGNRAFDLQALLGADELRLALKLWDKAGGASLGYSISWWRVLGLLLRRALGGR